MFKYESTVEGRRAEWKKELEKAVEADRKESCRGGAAVGANFGEIMER